MYEKECKMFTRKRLSTFMSNCTLNPIMLYVTMRSTVHSCRWNAFTPGLRHESNTAAPASPRELSAAGTIRALTQFSHQQTGRFIQQPPTLANSFSDDIFLQRVLEVVLPVDALRNMEPDLLRFGERCVTDIYEDHIECSHALPQLQKYDAFGNYLDRIITTAAWKRMKTTSSEEGLVAIAYERKYHEWSRIYQMIKIMLFGASSGMYNCPLAMTDGAAKVLEVLPAKLRTNSMSDAFERLTSRDPEAFWTSGQWMTEKSGGSDVRNATQTVATKNADEFYRLYGFKWFSSACDGEMALTLAKIIDVDSAQVDAAPTMFYVETRERDVPAALAGRHAESPLNNIHILQLKNKFGTRQLPTGELLLDGTVAERASERGKGIAAIAAMLNITRLHNAAAAVSTMRRVTNIARDYAQRRSAFGRLLSEHALHMRTLASLETQTRVNMLVVLEAARLLGRQEATGMHADVIKLESLVLRTILPLVKLYSGKQAVAVCSEAMEAVGGMGYLEDSQMPGYLRDAQVLPIWEGTTNILALDVLRSLQIKIPDSDERSVIIDCAPLQALFDTMQQKISPAQDDERLKECVAHINSAILLVGDFIDKNFLTAENPELFLQTAARDLAYTLYRTYAAALLVELICKRRLQLANITDDDLYTTLKKWCENDGGLVVLKPNNYDSYDQREDSDMVMAGYSGSDGDNRYRKIPHYYSLLA